MRIAYLFLRGEPAVWFEHAAQPRMYMWNKFRSSLERNFGSLDADLERRIVKEFGNNTDDSSEGGLGQCKDAGPSSALGKDTGNSGSDSSDTEEDPEEDSKEDPEEDTDGTETRSRV